jgi:hypothetical protein
MRDSLTTLFSVEPTDPTPSSAIAISSVAHAIGFALIALSLKHAPRVSNRTEHERYTVRLLRAPRMEGGKRQAQTDETRVSSPLAETRSSVADISTTSSSKNAANLLPKASSAYALPQPQLAHPPTHSQILLQPDAPPDAQLLQPVAVPVAVIWTAANLPTKVIVAPAPQATPVANLRPAIIKPNREPNLADVNISATRFPSPVPVLAGSISPVVVRGPEAPKQVPTTSSAETELPKPAQLISLSSLQATGDVVIPLANQSVRGEPSKGISPSRPDDWAGSGGAGKNGGGNVENQSLREDGQGENGRGAGETTSDRGGYGSKGLRVDRAAGTQQESGPGYEASVTHLTLPKDGQFGVVVVGSSVADEYPEVVEIWHGRLVYTVYLHVGTGKSWIMQYTVPANAEAASGGAVTKPEAPWPYDILRPRLGENDYTADAIMVHGFVNLAGRFEKLGLVLPQGFTQAKLLMDSLMQWKFRPAKQGTSLAMVEVLLIIPADQ